MPKLEAPKVAPGPLKVTLFQTLMQSTSKIKVPKSLGQREAAADGGVEVLVAGIQQVEWRGAWCVADQVDRALVAEMLAAFLNWVGVHVLDRGAAGPDADIAGGGSAGAGAVAAVDAGVGRAELEDPACTGPAAGSWWRCIRWR